MEDPRSTTTLYTFFSLAAPPLPELGRVVGRSMGFLEALSGCAERGRLPDPRPPQKGRQLETVEMKVRIDCEGCESRSARRWRDGRRHRHRRRPQENRVTVTGYVDAAKVMRRVARKTGKRVEPWPYVPYDVVAHPTRPAPTTRGRLPATCATSWQPRRRAARARHVHRDQVHRGLLRRQPQRGVRHHVAPILTGIELFHSAGQAGRPVVVPVADSSACPAVAVLGPVKLFDH
ncbi:hypothetical protein ZWY2020_011296 [Hordeum vulgare]|nr:hypothetical protein ZWY2020_011296 [Hordeum vulgare]